MKAPEASAPRQPMRLAPEARPLLLGMAVVTLLALGLAGPAAAVVPAAAWGFILFFFRDPDRAVPEGERLVLAPADGRVVALAIVDDPGFPEGRSCRLSIFLSIFDVHVNRAPVSGRVVNAVRTPGRFRAAFRGKASEENERNRLDIATPDGPVAVTQIAGAIARRIVCDVRAGDCVIAGRRFGLIRFGSRVDLSLPLGAEVQARVGDKVRAGSSVLALMPVAEELPREVPRAARL